MVQVAFWEELASNFVSAQNACVSVCDFSGLPNRANSRKFGGEPPFNEFISTRFLELAPLVCEKARDANLDGVRVDEGRKADPISDARF